MEDPLFSYNLEILGPLGKDFWGNKGGRFKLFLSRGIPGWLLLGRGPKRGPIVGRDFFPAEVY